ncbi:Uncharacterized membrane protein YcaP, DUF421 family [Salinibacillus kushneri]|uniref:Uncharacterized membrane protein YcaP, DUF421 family n=1 Tax=Salinibacillus kushneri TaxID=237682 RepID=A0A1I0CMM4_9BACI|nr:DUF421 domain-containing protein [Salinibacillus kushneri]SET20934.1 Uncharacterized membrane protein YcaP, DUF421 family [Salinibacillus kushneri]
MPDFLLIFVRTFIAFLVLFILTRLMGKKQISQFTFFDYVTGITIGSIAATVSVNESVKIMKGVYALVYLTIFLFIISYIALKSFAFRGLVEGSPTILVENGKILEENLKKVRFTYDDLLIRLREKNAFKVSDVELAVLETDGQVSVMKKAGNQPLTPQTMGLMVEDEHRPQIVIIDGKLIEKKLKEYGYTKEWLLGEINKQGAQNFSDVFLAQIDSKGNVYVDLYVDDTDDQQIQQKPLLAAQLRKIQADLEGFALQTKDKETKQLYYEQSQQLQQLINDLNPLLK